MSGWYLDTSAGVKLIVREPHSAALRSWVVESGVRLVGSELTRTELVRVARRRDEVIMERALLLLQDIDVVSLPAGLFRDAAAIDPVELRTLDALHLAAALDLRDDIEGIVTYDARLADAATAHGLLVAAPA